MKNYLLTGACIFFAGCDVAELRDPTLVVGSGEVISLVVVDENFSELTGKQSLLADSGSVCFLKAVLRSGSDRTKEIVFSTTGGVFTSVGVSPTAESLPVLTVTPADREVVIQLNALDVANANVVVSATTEKVSDVVELAFTTSYSHDFQVNPVATSVEETEEVEIHVEAIVKNGCMSEGQYLRVSATADDGIILDYPQFVKIVNQKATFKVANKSQAVGNATIAIELATASDETKSKEVTIVYK